MRPLARCALGAAVVMLIVAPSALARPDGPLHPYLEHQEEVLEDEEEWVLALRWPADGRLTDDYGPRWGRMHSGIDIGVLRSLPLPAAAAGTVTQTGYVPGYGGYGNVVVVDIGRGYSTLYAHLSRVDVRKGQEVEAGARIGVAGCTGSCTGTHLHFELRRGGAAIDPMPYIVR
jgi:murein DD-endopeptidase MepM/ murein hydrolase activator NlpD